MAGVLGFRVVRLVIPEPATAVLLWTCTLACLLRR